MKYGNLNFLEPSVPLQACNGTALPFYVSYIFQQLWHVQETHMKWGELGLGGHASTQDLKQ
jgi:hypothetical protein